MITQSQEAAPTIKDNKLTQSTKQTAKIPHHSSNKPIIIQHLQSYTMTLHLPTLICLQTIMHLG